MTYHDNRDREDYRNIHQPKQGNLMYWVLGSLVVLAVILGIAYATNDTDVASSDPPATTANAPTQNPARETTGSGAKSLPMNPNATAPQKDPGQPNR